MVSDSVSNLVHQEKLGGSDGYDVVHCGIGAFCDRVSMIGYDVISTRKRREHRAGKL